MSCNEQELGSQQEIGLRLFLMAVEDDPFCRAAVQEGGGGSCALSPAFSCTSQWYIGRIMCSLPAYVL